MKYLKYNPDTYEVTEFAPTNKGAISNYNSPTNHDMLMEDGYMPLNYETNYDGKIFVEGYLPEEPIDVLRSKKIAELKLARDNAEQKFFTFKNVRYDGDVVSIMRLNLAASVAKNYLDDPTYIQLWVDYDNGYQQLTAQDMQDIIIAVKDHSQNCHNRYGMKKIEVSTATREQIPNITWDS